MRLNSYGKIIQYIEAWRVENGYTLREMAGRVGYSGQGYKNMISGKSCPSIEMLEAYCNLVGLKLYAEENSNVAES